jgi:hypothetical protein
VFPCYLKGTDEDLKEVHTRIAGEAIWGQVDIVHDVGGVLIEGRVDPGDLLVVPGFGGEELFQGETSRFEKDIDLSL